MFMQPDYPDFLQAVGNLRDHFEEEFNALTSYEKGEKFADFAEKLCPHTPFASKFGILERQKVSHDGGVDFKARRLDGACLCTQSKFTIPGKDDFDSIISKFQNFQKEHIDQDMPLFASVGISLDEPTTTYFQIITMHDLTNILKRYEQSQLASVEFYWKLKEQKLLDIFDGQKIFEFLREAYMRSFVLPSEFELPFVTNFIEWMDVYIGIVSGRELRRLYEQFGTSLFFENIRDYLGRTAKEDDVNDDILRTAEQQPEKMLARNNGLVLKAKRVEVDTEKQFTLNLFDASIVNGCQTTMSILEAENIEDIDEKLYVAAKVVKSSDGWDVARTANRQNEVGKLELLIAEFLRPQRIKESAARRGISIEDNTSPMAVLNTIYRRSVVYEDMRSFFIGLFSRTPNNLFDSDRSAVLRDVLEMFFKDDAEGEGLFEDLFTVQLVSNECNDELRTVPNKDYKAFFREGTHNYRAFLAVLGICCACEIDISISEPIEQQYSRRQKLLQKAVDIIRNQRDRFDLCYKEAFRTIIIAAGGGGNEENRQQALWDKMKQTNFSTLYEKTLMSAGISQLPQ